jgi:dienelactone hydrolase
VRRGALSVLGLVVVAAVAIALTARHSNNGSLPPSEAKPPAAERRLAGRGATGAYVFRPAGAGRKPLPVVVFLHGWGGVDPRSYQPWIEHLAGEGNEVIYPIYQAPPYASPGTAFANMVGGLRHALAAAPVDRSTLVVAGHSAGGALSADYAASARRLGLPVPKAIMQVYPGRAIPGLAPQLPEVDPGRIPARVRILSMVGQADRVVGSAWARRTQRLATRVPRSRKRLVLVTAAAADFHDAPAYPTPAAQATFWAPLDRLIATSRAAPPATRR